MVSSEKSAKSAEDYKEKNALEEAATYDGLSFSQNNLFGS